MIPLIIRKLTDVPAAWRSEYVARGDGFELDIVGPLKSALAAERKWNAAVRKLQWKYPELHAAIQEVDESIKDKLSV
jgi:hypothetical protein